MNLCNKKCQKAGNCIYKKCPYKVFRTVNANLSYKKEFVGPLVNTFIGSFNYPNVNMSVIGNYNQEVYDIDSVPEWKEQKLDINDIMLRRSQTINAAKQNNVKSVRSDNNQKSLRRFSINKPITPTQKKAVAQTSMSDSVVLQNSFSSGEVLNKKFLDQVQLLSMSKKRVDGELNFSSKMQTRMANDGTSKPFGPRVNLKEFDTHENIHVPTFVDRVVSDELSAKESLEKLNKKDFDVYYLTKIFSTGNLGKQKRIVPTKWSITAVDDTISLKNLEKVKGLELGNDYLVYSHNYLGNYYIIVLSPNQFSYQLNEIMIDNVVDLFANHMRKFRELKLNYEYDYENFYGRKNYANNTAGAYYAGRLAASEKLLEKKRQYGVNIFRFISDEYYVPLGVWVVREGIKDTLAQKPMVFDDVNLVKNYIAHLSRKKYRVNIGSVIEDTPFFNIKEEQSGLGSFL